MFAYCNNNSVNYVDPVGTIADVIDPLKGGAIGGAYGSTSLDAAVSVVTIGIISFFNQVLDSIKTVTASSINWGSGDKNHILKGTKKTHVSGWKKFGIDPENGNNNNWSLLLPILKEVVDEADTYKEYVLSNGSKLLQYTKTYVDLGVQVVVKIWVSADGAIQQLSDAIPYIIDG